MGPVSPLSLSFGNQSEKGPEFLVPVSSSFRPRPILAASSRASLHGRPRPPLPAADFLQMAPDARQSSRPFGWLPGLSDSNASVGDEKASSHFRRRQPLFLVVPDLGSLLGSPSPAPFSHRHPRLSDFSPTALPNHLSLIHESDCKILLSMPHPTTFSLSLFLPFDFEMIDDVRRGMALKKGKFRILASHGKEVPMPHLPNYRVLVSHGERSRCYTGQTSKSFGSSLEADELVPAPWLPVAGDLGDEKGVPCRPHPKFR